MIKLSIFTIIFIFAFSACKIVASTTINFDTSKGFYLKVDGSNYEVKGVASEGNHLEILKDYGGNTIRTWTIDGETLDKAHKLGLKVVAGIWLDHMRHNDDFDYNNPNFIKTQRKVEAIIKSIKIILLYWPGDWKRGGITCSRGNA